MQNPSSQLLTGSEFQIINEMNGELDDILKGYQQATHVKTIYNLEQWKYLDTTQTFNEICELAFTPTPNQ